MSWEAGQELESTKKTPITREQLKDYAEASGDYNKIHLEDEFAKEAGFPSVIAHGMLSMGFLADLVQKSFPPDQYRVERLKSRFRKVTFPEDVLTFQGKVKEVQEDGRLVVAVSLENQRGEIATDGEALIAPAS